MKNYYKIDEKITMFGIFELWESEIYGEESPGLVTLNSLKVGYTYDSLNDFINDNY